VGSEKWEEKTLKTEDGRVSCAATAKEQIYGRAVVHAADAWQKAIDLVTEVYKTSSGFPPAEIYGLTRQIRRAAVSVPSNIAEGQARLSTNEFKHFLGTARGSLVEVQTQLVIAERLGFIKKCELDSVMKSAVEVQSIINGLLRSLQAKS
jgi:four helix bundle protein